MRTTIADKSETIYLGCECHTPEHIIRVSYFDWGEKDMPELYFELQADRHQPFWHRVKMAFKFVFGRENLSWHDNIPTRNDITKLQRVLDNYQKDYILWEQSTNTVKDKNG